MKITGDDLRYMKVESFMKKIFACFLTLALLVGCSSSTSEEEKDSITVTFIDDETTDEKVIEYSDDDTLVSLVEDNFDNVSIENGMLMDIDDYETPEDWSSFICIYVDGEVSDVGIEDIELTDGMEVTLEVTEYTAQ